MMTTMISSLLYRKFIGKKANYALSQDLGIIDCIGELLQEREEGKIFDVCFQQLKAFADVAPSWDNVVNAYKSVWAIGTGKVASPQQAQEVHAVVREWISKNVSVEVASKTCTIYGDPTYSSYEALRFVSGVTTTFTPGAGLQIIQSYMEGYRQDKGAFL